MANCVMVCVRVTMHASPQVRIVRERTTSKIMAMKKLKKAEMLRRGQVEHVRAERNVLAEVHSPYVVKLFYSFQVRSAASRLLDGGRKGAMRCRMGFRDAAVWPAACVRW